MPLQDAVYYCSQDDVEAILSANGVRLRLDDDGSEEISAEEQEAMDFALGDAAVTIDQYLAAMHTPAYLATSRWVNNRAAWLSVLALCERRGNPVPESLMDRSEKIFEELEYHRDTSRPIAGVPLRTSMAPTWSNVRVDPRYQFKAIRVEKQTSSRRASSLQTFTDWQAAFSVEY